MDLKNLIDLILHSIEIIGVFIAIIIGLVISKVMELRKEKEELSDAIVDLDNELETLNKQFKKLKENNYNFYKENCVYDMVEAILSCKEYEFYDDVPYVSIDEQKQFFSYVKEYSSKVMGLIEKNITKAQCVKKLNSTHNSIEEIIIEELYDWREE